MKLYCYDPKKGKNVLAGAINEYSTFKEFVKIVNNKHFMIKEKGYGIQEEILQQLQQLNITKIRIITKTSMICSNLEDWLKRPIKNYGHGSQRFLGGK